MAKNKVISNPDATIIGKHCNILIKKNEDKDIQLQTVVSGLLLSEYVIPYNCTKGVIDYLKTIN